MIQNTFKQEYGKNSSVVGGDAEKGSFNALDRFKTKKDDEDDIPVTTTFNLAN